MRFTMAVLAGALALGACGGSREAAGPAPDDPQAFQNFLSSLENTLVEVNELERMGGGIRDRMILVDAASLVKNDDRPRLDLAIQNNYGMIRSLRSSLETNKGVQEVMSRNGRELSDLLAIDAKPEGVVILYYQGPN